MVTETKSVETKSVETSYTSAYTGKVPRALKFGYALGAAAETIISVAFNAFNFFFYTNILGIPGTLAGLAITIALVFDAISDPVVGAWSDRWRSKLGRRHPFMLTAPIPVMVSLYFVYSPPENLETFGLFVWLTVLTVIMRSSMTLYHVPHLALGAELSADFTERTRIMSLNTLIGAVGGYGIAFYAYAQFFAASPGYPNGMLNPAAYHQLAVWAAGIGGSIMVLTTITTMTVIPRLPPLHKDIAPFSFTVFISDFQSALKNRNYLLLLVGYLLLSATIGLRETINIHVNTYYWELIPAEIKYFTIFGVLGPIIGFMLSAPLHNKFEKKPVLVACLVTFLMITTTPILLRMTGLFPANDSPLFVPTLLTFYVMTIAVASILLISAMSALADVADEHELETGRRQEGIFYSARSFFGKASSGFGHLLAGIAIDVIEFPVNAQPGTVDSHTIFQLGLVDGPLAVIPGCIAIYFYMKFGITRKRHAEIQLLLTRRHAAQHATVKASVAHQTP